jgi:hypothetical protein
MSRCCGAAPFFDFFWKRERHKSSRQKRIVASALVSWDATSSSTEPSESLKYGSKKEALAVPFRTLPGAETYYVELRGMDRFA